MAAVLALSAAFFQGLAQIFAKQGLSYFTPVRFLTARLLIAWLFYTPLVLALGALTPIRVEPVLLLPIANGFFGPLIAWNLYLRALVRLDVTLAYPLSNAWLLVTVTLSYLVLREPFHLFAVLGTILVLVGVYLLFGRLRFRVEQAGQVSLGSALFLLGAVLSWGINSVVFKAAVGSFSPFQVNWIRMVVALSFLLPYTSFGLVMESANDPPTRTTPQWKRGLWSAAAAALCGDVISLSLQLAALQRTYASVAWGLISTGPLFATLLSMVFLKEKVDVQRAIGILTVTLGIISLAVVQ